MPSSRFTLSSDHFSPATRYGILVENIPLQYRSSAALRSFFEYIFPNQVSSPTNCCACCAFDLNRMRVHLRASRFESEISKAQVSMARLCFRHLGLNRALRKRENIVIRLENVIAKNNKFAARAAKRGKAPKRVQARAGERGGWAKLFRKPYVDAEELNRELLARQSERAFKKCVDLLKLMERIDAVVRSWPAFGFENLQIFHFSSGTHTTHSLLSHPFTIMFSLRCFIRTSVPSVASMFLSRTGFASPEAHPSTKIARHNPPCPAPSLPPSRPPDPSLQVFRGLQEEREQACGGG